MTNPTVHLPARLKVSCLHRVALSSTDLCMMVCSMLDLSNPLYKRDVEISDAGLANLAGN